MSLSNYTSPDGLAALEKIGPVPTVRFNNSNNCWYSWREVNDAESGEAYALSWPLPDELALAAHREHFRAKLEKRDIEVRSCCGDGDFDQTQYQAFNILTGYAVTACFPDIDAANIAALAGGGE